jgi:hypothetical protein
MSQPQPRKKVWSEKIFGWKRFLVGKFCWLEKKKFGWKKNLVGKKIWLKKFVGKNAFFFGQKIFFTYFL